ncbi:MAG: YchF/TatD family DNA exonuclease [bacterium]|nr:YchF/TatD family DNA exonuclease [bacterium]
MNNPKTPTLIDTHAHLDGGRFDDDRDDVIHRAAEAGVKRIIVPGADLHSSRKAVELAGRYDEVYAAVGIHPHDAVKMPEEAGEITRLAVTGKDDGTVIVIGETGFDYHYMHSPKHEQQENLRWHLELAQELELPVILHSRESDEDIMAVVDDVGLPERGAVLHCFSGGEKLARWALDWGMLLSFTGAITFRKTPKTDGVFALLSPCEVMVETDAPYMAPHPHRGKRCEPAYIPLIARRLAENLEVPYKDLVATTTLNARRFFGIQIEFGGDIVYELHGNLYVNLTNRCDNECTFCVRDRAGGVGGYDLWLDAEPLPEEVMAAIGEPARYREIVFCGYGEPTRRWADLLAVARWVKKLGGQTRLDSNGLGTLSNGYDITGDMPGTIDRVSISLNAPDTATYDRICPSRFGRKAYPAITEFIQACLNRNVETCASAVHSSGVDLDAVRAQTVKLGIELKVR